METCEDILIYKGEMKTKIWDFQVKKNIKWYILRLLRRSAMNKETLINKIVDLYLGYWRLNNKLIETSLSELEDNGLIKIDNLSYKITERGLEVLNSKEKALEEYDAKYISKEGCAKHSLWANVGLSALEFVIFIFFGGYELIYESRKLKQGEDPKLEKFSRFIKINVEKLTYNGVWASLWLLNLGKMRKEEHFNCLKRGLGRRFPVMLEEDDYDRIYSILEREGLVETVGDKLKLTQRGEEELKSQAISPSLPSYIHRSRFWFARRISQYAEGL